MTPEQIATEYIAAEAAKGTLTIGTITYKMGYDAGVSAADAELRALRERIAALEGAIMWALRCDRSGPFYAPPSFREELARRAGIKIAALDAARKGGAMP